MLVSSVSADPVPILSLGWWDVESLENRKLQLVTTVELNIDCSFQDYNKIEARLARLQRKNDKTAKLNRQPVCR